MEFVWLKDIEFFPPRLNPEALAEMARDRVPLCVATKSRNLGDALALSSLPRRLKARYPGLPIHTYPRGFNPIVFQNNPWVDRVSYIPDAVYGDDCNFGTGQLIQQKEQFFGLEPSVHPRPEIHLVDAERSWARELVSSKTLPGNDAKPLVILHPWGKTNSAIAPVEFWDALVARYQGRLRFWQVGVVGHGAIQGCEYYFLQSPGRQNARKLFALMERARAFVGIDSGPMHVARTFELPSAILTNLSDIEKLLERRSEQRSVTLYSENLNLSYSAELTPDRLDTFFDRVGSPAFWLNRSGSK
jgi:ADP-heptose:LPS heptosyltransferase